MLLIVYLSACGGGGGGDAPPAVAPQPQIVNAVGPGEFKDAVLLRSLSTAEITTAMQRAERTPQGVTPRYAVKAYRLTYLTVDGQGQQTLASALVALPQKPQGAASPVLSYQHGTLTRDAQAPSYLADVHTPEVVMASLGYIVLSADYVGYGTSKGVAHPYLLSGPSAAAVIDLMTAARYWRQTQQVQDNKQLFLAGYSEGGYVTMATHRALQAGNSVHRQQLAGVAPGAGPYNVALTLDEQLRLVRQANPLLDALLQPGLLKHLSESNRNHVRKLLLDLAVGDHVDVVFMPAFLDFYLNDDRASLDSLSSVYDWRPELAVSLFHGRDDRSVSYLNATTTLEAMRSRGAGNSVSLTECTVQPAGHKECVMPYWRFMLDHFAIVVKNL